MEIRVLKYFLAIVYEGGMNKAAAALHITQPTLSRQIAQLENEMGVKLFERGTRTIRLTQEGVLFRRRAEEIIALVERTKKDFAEQDEMVEGKIVIGGGELTAMTDLAEIIEGFHQKYPCVKYDIVTANANHIKEQMEKGLIDIGLLLEPIEIDKFDFVRLKEKERWVVLMRPEDELAKKNAISPEDLVGTPLVLPKRANVHNEVANWFGDCYKKLDVLFTSNLNTNGAIMVNQGLARSLVVEGAVSLWDKNKIVYRPLCPEMTANSVIAWKKEQPFNVVVNKFIKYMKSFIGGHPLRSTD